MRGIWLVGTRFFILLFMEALADLFTTASQFGDPAKAVRIIVDVVRGEGVANNKPFPKNLHLGSDCYEIARASAEESLNTVEEWKEVVCSTDYKD